MLKYVGGFKIMVRIKMKNLMEKETIIDQMNNIEKIWNLK